MENRKSLMRFLSYICFLVSIFCIPSQGRAAVSVDANALINVQFGETNDGYPFGGPTPSYSGPGVFSASSNNWNLIAGPFLPGPSSGLSASNIPLTNAAGGSSSVTLSYTTPNSFIDVSNLSAIFNGTPQRNLMTSYLFADSNRNGSPTGHDGPGTVVFGGLTPNAYYETLVYSAADEIGRGTTFSVGGVTQTVTPNGSTTFSVNNNFADFISRADVGGNISISMSAAGTGGFPEANLNGIQLRAIPQVDSHKLVNVQFGENNDGAPFGGPTPQYTGPGVVSGTAGNSWNLITNNFVSGPSAGMSASNIPLTDASGAPTSVLLSYSTPDSFIDISNLSPIFGSAPQHDLLSSYLFADSMRNGNPSGHDGPGSVTLSGLIPGAMYQLILESVADNIGRATLFVVDGMSQIVASDGVPIQGLYSSYAEFLVAAGVTGDITFTMSAVGTGGIGFPEANLNGIQLVRISSTAPIPEPSAYLTAIVGLFLLGWVQRRRA
ncbi:hypothetical protein [Fundidesulfovibrio terrae]|uniref:hypothetical protein n=1 Tax=Fundidesulfovibrio terrae TaxID=2922866 RepID=UPI001FAED7C2|nr:hypothetical protein [Fundidesulfovibrio terrae]